MKKLLILTAVMLLMMSAAASASTVTLLTSFGTATFTTGAGTVTVVLNDTVVNPTDVSQNISGVSFTLSGGQTAATLTSGTGNYRTIAGNGTYSDGGVGNAGWTLSSGGTGIFICDIGCTPSASGPAHTIVGAPGAGNLYSNGNGSIDGNGPHNPFLSGAVTFVLSVQGVTADTTITGGQLYYGTSGQHTTLLNTTPEPASMLLLGTGLVGLGGAIRRKIRL